MAGDAEFDVGVGPQAEPIANLLWDCYLAALSYLILCKNREHWRAIRTKQMRGHPFAVA